jgi:hypothetical protein
MQTNTYSLHTQCYSNVLKVNNDSPSRDTSVHGTGTWYIGLNISIHVVSVHVTTYKAHLLILFKDTGSITMCILSIFLSLWLPLPSFNILFQHCTYVSIGCINLYKHCINIFQRIAIYRSIWVMCDFIQPVCNCLHVWMNIVTMKGTSDSKY